MYLIGIDWADQHHDVYIQTDQGEKVDAFRIPHSAKGLQDLVQRLQQLVADGTDLAVAVETNQGLLVEALLDAGLTIYPINPKAVDRFRDRFRAASTKSDPFDAMVLADILRTDRHRFEPLAPASDLVRELKLLVEDYRHLVHSRTQLSNRLTSALKRYYPQAPALFSRINQKTTLRFLLRFPTPNAVRQVSVSELEAFLREQRYPGSVLKAREIHEHMEREQFRVDPVTARAKARLVRTLCQQLLELQEAIAGYEEEFERFLAAHPDAEIFLSLPGAATKLAARLLADIGDNRRRWDSYRPLQARAGTCPVTAGSGKRRVVIMRTACRKIFRETMHQFAFASLKRSDWAKDIYDGQRERGASHNHALRVVANHWLRIIYAMWRDQTLYDPDVHNRQRTRRQEGAA